jgi:membrane complex biogenesis BtpA family protein
MKQPLLDEWSGVPRPVIGMLHLRALPGAPRYDGDTNAIAEAMVRDAEALVAGGVHGLMLENFGDAPFYPDRVPAHVVAHVTALACRLRSRFSLPVGINVLRNDARSALAIAHTVGAAFIRVNVLCGARLTDQGIVQGVAHDLARDRARLSAEGVKILADVNVKHSAPLAPALPIEDEVTDTVERGGADALIVSGTGTGRPTDAGELDRVRRAAGDVPVFVGSGVTPETAGQYLPAADGFIVGTAFKRGGVADHPVDADRVRAFLAALA